MRRFGAIVLVVVTACQQSRSAGSSVSPSSPGAAKLRSQNPTQAALNELDTRTAVPLLPMMANHQKQNMRDHLLAVQEIVAAVAVDDFPSAERAAGRMGFSEPMAQMCTHMGAGAPGFTERALEFHHTADTIAVAARAHDHLAVVDALGRTLSTCTGCHASFKQEIVDEARWRELTGAASTSDHARH